MSDPRDRASTRQRILVEGLQILSESGFCGVTLGTLADRVGMSKSGLFEHFKSKEQVELAILEMMMDVWIERVVRPSALAERGIPRLKGFFVHWLSWPSDAGLSGGCPLTAALFELDHSTDPIRSEVAKREIRWRRVIEELVEEAIETGEFSKSTNVGRFTWEVWAIYLSHHVSAHFRHDTEANSVAQRAFNSLVERSRSKARRGAASTKSSDHP